MNNWVLRFTFKPSLGLVGWKKKKAQCESCEYSFIWGKMRTAAKETAPQIALRNCPKEVGWRSVYIWFCRRGNICIKHIFFPKVSASLMTVTAGPKEPTSPWRTLVLLYIWGDIRIGLINHSPETILLPEDLFWQFLPEHRMPHSWSPPWTPFRGCWRSRVAVAHDLIFVEVDGKCQLVGDSLLLQCAMSSLLNPK